MQTYFIKHISCHPERSEGSRKHPFTHTRFFTPFRTILSKIRELLPQYNYLYLGDNARTPYGTRSFEVVYEFTLQAVRKLFDLGCPLVILACNTASAKALRSIQQHDLPHLDPSRRVLGVIRPTVECIGELTYTRHVGLLATEGTVRSQSYPLEIHKLYPDQDPEIDTIILGCTHYPLLLEKIRRYTPSHIRLVEQGQYVASSLKDYLARHPEIRTRCETGGACQFLTTESVEKFRESANVFLHQEVQVQTVTLE